MHILSVVYATDDVFLPVQDMGTLVMGKCESGAVMKGQSLLLMPNKVRRFVIFFFCRVFENCTVDLGIR